MINSPWHQVSAQARYWRSHWTRKSFCVWSKSCLPNRESIIVYVGKTGAEMHVSSLLQGLLERGIHYTIDALLATV